MVTTNSYDNLDRLTRTASMPSGSPTISFDYHYNNANQRDNVTNADGTFWRYGYDALGQITSGIKYWSDGMPVSGEQFGYAFDENGNRILTTSGGDPYGGSLRNASYAVNRLDQYTSRTVPGAVDITGSATNASTVTVNNQPTYRHGAFYHGRISLNNAGAAVYQSITNLTVLDRGGTVADLISNITGNVFLPQTPEQFTYDADGNLSSDGRWTNSWDAENRLISMTSLTNGPTSSKFRLTFAYDYRGRRISKAAEVFNGSAWTTNLFRSFVYDGWNLLLELNATNNGVIHEFMSGLNSGRNGPGVRDLISVIDDTRSPITNYFVCSDGSGNVAGLVSADAGTSPALYEYGPLGETLRSSGPMAKENPLVFSTKYQDSETGHSYFGYRYYSPITGRWLTRDPIGNRGGANNLYEFCGNDGIDRNDYLGLFDAVNTDVHRGRFWLHRSWMVFKATCPVCEQIDRGSIQVNKDELVQAMIASLQSIIAEIEARGMQYIGNIAKYEDAINDILTIYLG